jgi:LppP/LprE lipoprotein
VDRHSRSRASWLALAALGLGAAVLTGSSGGRSSTPADAAAAIDPEARAAIRGFDFGEVAPPGSSCVDGLLLAPPDTIAVDRGQSRVLDVARFTRLEIDPQVAYGDVDDDGDDEAVVHVVCTYGANGAEDTVHVWELRGGRVHHRAALREPPESITGPLPPAVSDVAVVDGGRIAVTWTSYADGDANCCPSRLTTVTYELGGGTLRRVGGADTRANT